METTLPLYERSIKELYLESQEIITYKIPIYQRNYAWEEDEIATLIKDVYDSFQKRDCRDCPVYYIGTLVTYKRGDNEYEVIDGQQRLTTIYLILKALGVKGIRNKLTYSARKVSASTISLLDSIDKPGEWTDNNQDVDEGIRNGYKFAIKALKLIDTNELKDFEEYFLRNVHLIHYLVPKDVDLNHYFEVMNSRGEQLEKHEIVKSWLCLHLKDNKSEVSTFSHVWETCSEMSMYIQQVFAESKVFGNNLNKFEIKCFSDIPSGNEFAGKVPISTLLGQTVGGVDEDLEQGKSDSFQPIIDFQNFLLIVLKLTLMRSKKAFDPSEFKLDDKELLNQFEEAFKLEDDKAEFARQFAFNLLKARFFLDNYIVHHSQSNKEISGDNPWELQCYYRESNQNKYPKNLYEDDVLQKELVHLLSMFEVSFTPKQRKNYLFYCLNYLFGCNDSNDNRPSGVDYRQFLRDLADTDFFEVYLNTDRLNERHLPLPNSFDEAVLRDRKEGVFSSLGGSKDFKRIFNEVYESGNSEVPLFVFNYTDYVLWRKYAEELRSKGLDKTSRTAFFKALGCSDFGLEVFKSFYCSRTRKSLEHFYPQAKAGDGKHLNSKDINCFGNFAMIGSEANSSGSNLDPKTKIDRYNDKKYDQVGVASLKFKIMIQKCTDNVRAKLKGELERDPGLEWDKSDILEHQAKMLDILIPDVPDPVPGGVA